MVQTNNNVKQEQGFAKLKAIHELQSGGEIGSMLRTLRDIRNEAEEYARKLNARKKELQKITEQSKDDVLRDISLPLEYESGSLNPISTSESVEENQTAPKFEKRTFGDAFDRKDNGFRTFNNQSGKDGARVYDRQKKFNNEQRSDNGRQFQKPMGPRQNQTNLQGARNGQRPFGKPGERSGNGFATSKSNNFRSFEQKESIDVLAQPERNIGNKNKNPNKNLDEKKQTFVKKSASKNNIIIEDDDGFSETTMGSRKLIKKKKDTKTFVAAQIEQAVITSENVTVKDLSEKTGKPVVDIIKKLMMLGVMATINSEIDFDTAELVASELGVKLEKKIEKTYEERLHEVVEAVNAENCIKRPPVVTIMGHVDHGKTSLLDAIRKTNIVNGEAGGITQHIGAYQITHAGEKITFIDTPGHAAFTAMRARGAKATDVAILVVAADDGVMPQTIEAINHIKAANVPMIVAINKIDKPTANIERIKQQLAENNVLPEEWGGDAILVPVSAKANMNLDELLNMILLCSEVADLKADPTALATGVILEATLDKNKGPMATVLVQNGTLKVGDNVISGLSYGKIKAMYDENGKLVKVATPSTPVSVLGLDIVPSAGDKVAAIDEKLSKKVIEERKYKLKQEQSNQTSGVSLDNFMSKVNEDKLKALNIIIKGDVQGSIEALKATLGDVRNEEAKVVPIHTGVGLVTESDVLLASASQAIVIAFNVKIGPKAKQLSEQLKVEIKEYNIIYQALDDLTLAINGMLTPKYEERYSGTAEIRAVFKLSSGTIAGCYVKDGKLVRNGIAHVMRDGEEVCQTTVEALRIVKDDKAEISAGYECGVKLKDTSFKEGDIIVVNTKERVN